VGENRGDARTARNRVKEDPHAGPFIKRCKRCGEDRGSWRRVRRGTKGHACLVKFYSQRRDKPDKNGEHVKKHLVPGGRRRRLESSLKFRGKEEFWGGHCGPPRGNISPPKGG